MEKAHHTGKDSTEARSPDMSDRSNMSEPPCGPQQPGLLPYADARATEEPEAGKQHVRVCTGTSGNRRSYRNGAM